jgi:hypothetical protein
MLWPMRVVRLMLAAGVMAGAIWAQEQPEKPRITAIERAQGWRFLFDGTSLSDWRGYGLNKVPANWTVVDGWLTTAGGPALASEDEYRDFELLFDWKVAPGGVGEVWLRALEDTAEPEGSGLLFELEGGQAIGGNGGLTEPWRKLTPEPGRWHRSRVLVYGDQVEYWVDGDRVLTYTIDAPNWREAIPRSRFAGVADYGRHDEGRIVLAGRGAAFRNIKVRRL